MGIKINTLAKEFYSRNQSNTIKRNTLANEFYSKYKNRGSNIGYVAANVGIGLAGMFEGISDFVGGSFYQLIGDKDYAKYLHMNDVTGGWKERLDKNFNPSSTYRVIGDISSGIGQAIPSVVLGVATGGTSAAVQAVGAVALGASYAGRGVTSAVQQTGELGGKENAYGVLSGSLEGATDMFLGGTVKAGKALITTARQSAKVGAKKIARNTVVKGMISSAGSEMMEEFIQEYADTTLLRLTGVNKEAEYSFGNAAYSALIGGITGGILGGATAGINSGINLKIGEDVRARGLEAQLLNTADYVRDVHIGNSKNFSNITSDSLRALTASVDAYRKLDANGKHGAKGAMILGEIKQELLAFESAAGVDATKQRMADSNEETRKVFAAEASKIFSKEITAEDIRTNKDGITERFALESYVSGILSESSMERAARERAEAITAERIPYIKSAASWSNESAAYRDPKSGRYVFVEPNSADGTWRMGFSPTAIYDENNIMVKDGISTEDVKKTLSGLADGSLEIGANSIVPVGSNIQGSEKNNVNPNTKKMYDIVMLDDGKSYVKASRNVITGNTLDEKRSQITKFFNDLIGENKSIDVTTIDGETLTITTNETADKARDNYREENGKRIALTDDEFLVKLHAEEHIDELAETATKNSKPLTPDTKNHNFAKDGFEYKSVYFQDYDGKYYKITLSIGHNGTIATVYNVGRIKEGTLPSAKVIAVRGSIGPWNAPSDNSIPQNSEKSTENGKKVNRKMLAEDEGVDTDTAQEVREGSQTDGSTDNRQESVSEAQEAAEAEYRGNNMPTKMTENERKRGYTDKEADTARSFVRDFDVMPREKRLAIIEMIRSGEDCGASKSFMKHAASMIGYWRKGLYIIADKDSLERGFYQTFGDGSRLIVVNPTKAKGSDRHAIDVSFVHELAHDIWNKATKKTKDELYRLATESATAAEVDDIRAELKRGYEARGLKLEDDVIREEIFTELISKTLGNEKFLERFDATPGRMTAFTRGAKAALRMAKCFVGKDRYLHRQTEKMTRAFIRAMGEEMVSEVLREENGSIRYLMGVTQEDIENYVSNSYIKNNTKDYIPYAEVDEKLISDVEADIDVTGYIHALRDNDIRHIKNSHGEETTEKYPVTKEDISKIPYIISNYDKVYVKTNARQEAGLVYVKVGGDNVVYYVEAVTTQYHNQKLLVNKQMIKTGFDEIPNLHGLIDAINKKEGESQYLADLKQIRKAYVLDVKEIYPNNSIPQNSEKSTISTKKVHSFSKEETDMIHQAMVNGGMIEKPVEVEPNSVETPKSQTTAKNKGKSKTKKQLKAENREYKKENRALSKANEKLASGVTKAQERASELSKKNQQLKKENEKAERIAVNAEKQVVSEKERLSKESAQITKQNAKLVKEVAAAVDFFKNEVMHRKYTSGGTVGATILADPGIRAFAEFFAKKSSAYNIMNKSTRVAFQLLGEFYNPQNPIFAEENNAATFFGEDSKNIFSSYRPEVAAMIDAIANGEGDLTALELKDFSDILKNVRHIYENYDGVRRQGKSESAKVLSAKDYYAQVEARSVLEDSGNDKPKLKRFFQLVKENYLYTVVTPEEVLRDLECHVKDPILSTLYREIRLGEAKAGKIRAEILTPITEFLADKENKELFKELKKPTVSFGGATITTAQAVGIYTTSKRKHAQDRMYDPDNGIRIYDHESQKNVVVKVKKSMVDKLYSSFDATTRAYIKHLEDAMAVCKKYKVDTDVEVMGFTNAIDGYYYPITTDSTYFVKDITDVRQSMDVGEVVKDKGFNKNTVQGAQAPLFIEDAQVVLERHVGGISQYAGLYIPLQNFGKVYSAKIDPTIPAEEQGRINDTDKLKEAMKLVKKTSLREYYNAEVWNNDGKKNGKNLDSYLTKLFADIQRIKPGDVSIIDKGVEVLRSGYVNAVFGLNPKIIMTQLASYPAAYRIIDTDCLAGAFGRNPLSDENQAAMDRYSLITLSRKFEGANAADGLIEKLSEFGKKTSAGIELTDRGTISFLYSACQLQIEKDGGAKVGTEENLKAAAELLDNVLLDTQTTSLLSDRSALARDKNEFAKMFSMFRNEAVKAFSNFYGAISSYYDHKRLSEKDKGYAELLEEDKKRISRNAISYLGSSAWVAVISIAFSKLYGLGKDDEEKEKLAVTLAKEGASAVFDLFPILSDAAGFMMDGYDLNSLPLEVFNDLLAGMKGVKTLVDPEATSVEKAKYLRNTAYAVSSVLGLPTKNADKLARTTVAIFNKPISYRLSNRYDTAPSYKSDLEKALEKSNGRFAQTIMTLWMDDKVTGEASVAAVNELTRLYSVRGMDGKSIFSMPRNAPASLGKKEKERFKTVYAEADGAMLSLISSGAYAGLDDSGKAAAVKACYDMYYVRAQAACGLDVSESGARISAAVSKLDPNVLYAVMGYAKTLSGDGKKDMIIKYLSSLGIPQKARGMYLEALGYKIS